MAYSNRKALIEKLQSIRGSKVICFITSTRPGVPAQIAGDQVRVFFDHLQAIPNGKADLIDVFLITNGGDSTVPWRLVSLIREYADKLGVLIPFKAMSAGSIFALGADEIVMHPLAEMGPIDPTVTNEFNPRGPHGQYLGISVEDVKSFVSFAKSTVGIETEEGRIKALELLTHHVHPLALGNVDRFINQARLVGEKILKTHMGSERDAQKIKEIVENMASKLYFHGHPINRKEARDDLNLQVMEHPSVELEETMLKLFLDFEDEFKMKDAFNPLEILNSKKFDHTEKIKAAQLELIKLSVEIGAKNSELNITTDSLRRNAIDQELQELVLKQNHQQVIINTPLDTQDRHKLMHACIESEFFSDTFDSQRLFTMSSITGPGGQQFIINEEILKQGWSRCLA